MEEQQESFFSKYKWYILGLGVVLAYIAFGNQDENTSQDYYSIESTTITEPTEGVITKIKEVEPEIFKITDEELVPTKEESRIIATYIDGEVDTFLLEEIAVVDTTVVSEDRGYRRRSGISTALHYGLLGYWLGRPMGTPTRQSSYANREAYNRSESSRTRMNNSAVKRTVRSPRPSSTGKSGYGSGRSTKSYGG